MSSITDHRSQLKDFLSSISTIKGDLSNITAPPFVLAPQSAVEFPAAWAEHPAILVAPAAEPDPQKRALLVLKWYLSSLKRQQYTGASESDGVKKPLNAFLGELFIASYDDSAGSTRLIAEQVSHHPPVTACYLWNTAHGVRAEGYTAPSMTLTKSLSVRVEQIGHAIVHIDRFNEAYLVTLPTLSIKGLLSGTPYPELVGETFIKSSSGFTAHIEYEGKGWFSGRKNSFSARLFRTAAPDEVLYTVDGQWNDTFTFREGAGETVLEVYDTNADKATSMKINDVAEQDPWESRRAWRGVIEGIKAGDMQAIATEKDKIEVAQREMRKKEQRDRTTWQPAVFARHDGDELFDELAKGLDEQLRQDKTDGVWKFDLDKAAAAQSPYHGDLTPWG